MFIDQLSRFSVNTTYNELSMTEATISWSKSDLYVWFIVQETARKGLLRKHKFTALDCDHIENFVHNR